MANNENSDGIETNDSINKINDSNNNVFNLEVLTKELLEIKSQLGKVNELAEHLQKELIKEKKKNLKERNEELLESHSQESETVIREKSKLKDLKKGLNKKKIKEVKERTEGLAQSMDSSFQELESILENEKLKIEDLPDLEPLLEKLDNKYFKGILKKNNVKVTYSKKMFVSAGACVEEEDNRPVEIRLSAKVCQEKNVEELIETLLHEMVHAFLFITKPGQNIGHGPEFVKIMDRINQMEEIDVTITDESEVEVKYLQNLNE